MGMVKTGVELKLEATALLKATAALLLRVAMKPQKVKPELKVAVRKLGQKLRLETHV